MEKYSNWLVIGKTMLSNGKSYVVSVHRDIAITRGEAIDIAEKFIKDNYTTEPITQYNIIGNNIDVGMIIFN